MNGNDSNLNQKYKEYREELIARFWDFQRNYYQNKEVWFERVFDPINSNRPPVFKRDYGENNVLVNDDFIEETKKAVREMIPKVKWHRWFKSMTSSQALAQSIFGNLKVLGKLDCLADLRDDGMTQPCEDETVASSPTAILRA